MKTRILLPPLVQPGGETFYFKKKLKKKKNRNQRQIVATQKRKKMKKGVVAAALVQGAQQKFRSQNKGPKIKIKIATRSLRNKHARKVHENCTLPERAQKAKGEIHAKFRGEKKDPQINK
jgi:hypothetical protein